MRASLPQPSLVVALLMVAIATARLATAIGGSHMKGFFNHSGCLYAYMKGGSFEIRTADNDLISEELDLDSLSYDSVKTRCSSANESGKIVFSFRMDEKSKIKSITIGMRIVVSPSEGYWEISQANLTIARADTDRRRTFPLKVNDMYAGQSHSYSCNELTLQTQRRRKSDNETGRVEPRATITLQRFQLQPFSDDVVFAPSFDCSTWFSVPGLMGLAIILFMTMVIVIGANVLLNISTNDFKYNKEGQLFTQSQLESNKHQ